MLRPLLLLVLVFAFGSLAPAVAEAGYWRCYKGCKARVRVWLLHYATLNFVRLPGLERLVLANPLLRRLYFLAFDAQVDSSARISYEAVLIDPWLVSIGPGAKVGAFARIGGHAADLSSFTLARTTIGPGALIGADALLGPGVTVGEGALVAPRSAVAPGTNIPSGELWGGIPARSIGRVEDLALKL